MTTTPQTVEDQSQSSFAAGMLTGSLGCLSLVVACVIGLIVGFQTGHEFFAWHYRDSIAEIRKHEPLLQWSWSCQGALIGGVTLPVITLICWSVIGSWIRKITAQPETHS